MKKIDFDEKRKVRMSEGIRLEKQIGFEKYYKEKAKVKFKRSSKRQLSGLTSRRFQALVDKSQRLHSRRLQRS